jgi:hypothetical protein
MTIPPPDAFAAQAESLYAAAAKPARASRRG